MNNKTRIITETEKDVYLPTAGKKTYGVKHRIVERKLRMLPEMLIVQGRIYYDYTAIMMHAWETGQEARVKRNG